jgi:hypothetical protein
MSDKVRIQFILHGTSPFSFDNMVLFLLYDRRR